MVWVVSVAVLLAAVPATLGATGDAARSRAATTQSGTAQRRAAARGDSVDPAVLKAELAQRRKEARAKLRAARDNRQKKRIAGTPPAASSRSGDEMQFADSPTRYARGVSTWRRSGSRS